MAASASIGAIVLCGGESRRMGRDKATLPFGPETMLERVVGILSPIAKPIVVAAAANQELPPLAGDVRIVTDPTPGMGPWQGIAAGMRLIAGVVDVVLVVGCDTPLLRPAWIGRLAELIGEYDVAAPFIDGFMQPLSALYRPAVLGVIESLLEKKDSPLTLFDRVSTRRVTADELRDADPDLESLLNVNNPDDYRRALSLAGYSIDGLTGI